MELVMNVVDAAVVQHRKDDLCWSLTLSLVCRTIRTCVLPALYEVLFLDIRSEREREFIGWDGQTHRHVELAFLSWLLHDPSAPPRRHVKHIVFRHDGQFNGEDIKWIDSREASSSTEWLIERLTVRFVLDADGLYRAGLRSRKSFQIASPRRRSGSIGVEGFERMVRIILRQLDGSHTHTWATRPEEVVEDGTVFTGITQSNMTQGEIDPKTGASISEIGAGRRLTVQLEDGDYLQQYPDYLLTGLAAGLSTNLDVQIVLACAADYRIGGQTVVDFIRKAVPTSLPQAAVEGKLRVSHAAPARLVESDMFLALAQALQCGGDPWDLGHAI